MENASCKFYDFFLFTKYSAGASKQLGTIIEGESLLNDGAAIVLFNVLINELIPEHSQTGTDGGS